ncbi:MAG: alpha/beta hydrolase [Flavobacteriales bacterium]|nr:MAG: alpha/beta hydrolase [Flavobacteriales bacterium]
MEIKRNIIVQNPETKAFLADAFYQPAEQKLPLVVFLHGYKGYKDWGAWDLMCKAIANQGFYVVKFNSSHNGTSLEKPNEFADLESFGQNNYTKELADIQKVIDVFSEKKEVDNRKISLIGHSRGGGLSIIQAFENPKIKALITLASVSSLDRFPKGEKWEEWKEKGVFYAFNGRTKQQMPHYFQFFEDYQQNKERLNVQKAVENLDKPYLIIHGTEDKAVDFSNAEQLHQWNTKSKLIKIDNANHTFGAVEPWLEKQLPPDLQKATDYMIEFLNQI